MKVLLVSIIILFLLSGCGNNTNTNVPNEVQENPTNISENNVLASENNVQNNVTRISVGLEDGNYNTSLTPPPPPPPPQPVETELSAFSTKVLTKDPKRNNNISLTCESLNGHIIKSGETFSFTGTVGKATETKGYEKANVFTAEGDTIKALGGGNCQVSSTLYNAVLALPELAIVERHEHSAKVHYVPDGKDAAVAYGSVDFKFKNNFPHDIKLYATSDVNNVNIKIVKV